MTILNLKDSLIIYLFISVSDRHRWVVVGLKKIRNKQFLKKKVYKKTFNKKIKQLYGNIPRFPAFRPDIGLQKKSREGESEREKKNWNGDF